MDNLTELKLTGGKDCQDVLTGDNGGADVSVKFMSIVHSDDAVFTTLKETYESDGTEVSVLAEKGRAAIPGPLVPRDGRYFSSVNLSAGSLRGYIAAAPDYPEKPTSINLSSQDIDEGNAIGDVVGTFGGNGTDPVYELISGALDNASFTIDAATNELKAAEVFNYTTKNSYEIRVRASNDAGATVVELPITINDVP